MKLESRKVLNRSLQEVYDLVKNDLAKLVPYLPNVAKIEVKSSTPKGDGKTELVNNWYAKVDLPSMLTKFIKPEIFSWKDVAIWDDNTYSVSYELTSFLVGDLFEAKGVNSFKVVGEGKTELTVSCSIHIYPEKVPGVPRLLAGSVRPMIEALIEKIIGPNLASLGDGLEKYFQGK